MLSRIMKPKAAARSWIAAAALLFMVSSTAILPVLGDERTSEDEDSSFGADSLAAGLNSDRKTLSALESLRENLAEGLIDEALDEFRRLRTSDPHAMVPVEPDSRTFVPLFRVLFGVFQSLPAEIRRQQNARDGAVADQMLQEILSSGTPSMVPELILQAPGSDASIQGHLLVARLHLDRNHDIAARAWLQPLLLEGVPQAYRTLAEQLLKQLGTAAAAQDGGRTTERANLPSPEPLVIPEHVAWQFRPVVSPKLNRQITTFRRSAEEAKSVVETTWTDLADDECLYRRTMRGLISIDKETGKPRWQFPLLPSVDSVLSADRSLATAFGAGPADANLASRFQQFQYTRLADLFCRDNVQGKISSDSKHAYLITTDPDSTTGRGVVLNRGFGPQVSSSSFANARIVALEKQTGRRVWSAGLEVFRDHLKTESDSCWICGPPCESRNRLYCVVEWAGEMRLACLAAPTGEVLWSAALSIPDQSIRMDPIRRLWGAVPEASGGLIWTPTTTGWTACVDEITRSVVWASPLKTDVQPDSLTRVARGRPVALTAAAPISQRWPVSLVKRAADLLVVVPHESHEIAILDALTGQTKHRIPVGPLATILHLDDIGIIYAESSSTVNDAPPPGAVSPAADSGAVRLTKINAATGKQDWSRSLPADAGLPTGAAAAFKERLLVPMSTGHIAAVSPFTGQIRFSDDVVIPVGGWGRLAVSGEDDRTLLYSAPDVLLKLSVSESSGAPESPLELAAVLMDSEKWQQAIDVLQQIPETDPQFDKSRDLQFRCRQALAMGNPERNLEALKDVAVTPEQKVRVSILEVEWLHRQQKTAEAIEQLLDVIQQHPILLTTLTDSNLFAADSKTPAEIAVHRPLLTRATDLLSDMLAQVPETDSVAKQLKALPVAMLLRINHPAVRPVLHQYLQAAELSEESLHVLHHCLGLRRMLDDVQADVSAEAEALVRFSRELSDSESGIRRAVSRMLTALVLELSPDVVAAVRTSGQKQGFNLPDRNTLDHDFAEQLRTRFQLWTASDYLTEPVLRVSSVGTSRIRLFPVVDDDPLLRHYQWTAVRGDFGRLHAVSTTSPDDQWSVPGVFGQINVYSSRPDFVRRNGSQLLVQTYQGLTAVSLVEQRAAWSVTPDNRSAATSFSTTRGFADFVAGRDRLPSASAFSQVRVIGTGHGWVCLQAQSEIRMVESLTGRTLWSTEIRAEHNQVLAGDDVVIIGGFTVDQPVCLDRRSGAVIDIPEAKTLAARAISGQGPYFVCWKSATADQPAALEWVRQRSGQTDHRIELPELKQFSFSDDATLVGFSDNRLMQVTSLTARTSRRFSFATADDADFVAEKADGDAAQAAPPWSSSRLQMVSDGMFYLVSNKPTQPATSGLPSGRQLLQFEGDLRAIDPGTGAVVWTFRGTKSYLATTDQPDLPVLVVISSEQINQGAAANSMAGVNHFHGLARVSGESVFRQVVSSQYGLRYLSLKSPRPNVIDLSVYGQRLRLTGMEPKDKRSSNSSRDPDASE